MHVLTIMIGDLGCYVTYIADLLQISGGELIVGIHGGGASRWGRGRLAVL